MQPRLCALEHLLEAIAPRDVQPRRVRHGGIGGAVAVTDGQLHIAVQPLRIRHFGRIAEVLLGGQLHRGDDLVATLGHRVGITGDIIEQATTTRGSVVDLVDVGAQLAAPGGHAALGFSGRYPLGSALGLDKHLLDRRRGGGLQGGHGRGTDEDAVDRHQRETELQSPTATEVFSGLLGSSDSTTDTDGDVGTRAQLRIGGQQQVVQVFPGVVSPGAATLDVHDDRAGGHLGGDTHHRADLLNRARLEDDMGEADVGEFLDECDGLFQLGNAGGHHDTVDRRTGLTSLLHQALRAHLQLPQVGIQEQ